MRVYKYQLKPTKCQEQVLYRQFYLCRFTYNKLLEFLHGQTKPDKKSIQHKIVELKQEYPELQETYSKTLQYECYRLFANLKSLGKSKSNGHKVGKLRFKGRRWFKTIVYNQSGFKLIHTGNRYNQLHLSKIGDIKIRQHREYEGNIKGIVIKRKALGWEAHIITDAEYRLDKGDKDIGIDLGVMQFIVTSDNERVDNPLYMNKVLRKIQALHKKISKTKKGSKNRQKICFQLRKLWEHIENQKRDFFHKITTKLVNQSNKIVVEDLNIKDMVSNSNNKYYNHRNILDSSWGMFLDMLKHKAESAGVRYVAVNPRGTSKMCSSCGKSQNMPLHKRTYACECGNVIDRDYNSALNILRKGLTFVETEVTKSMKQEAPSVRAV